MEPAPSQAALDRVFAEEDSLADVWETPAQAGTMLSATMTAPVNRLPEKPLPQPMPTPKVSAGWLGRGLRVLSAVCLLLAGWCFWPASSSLPKTPTAAAKTETRLLTRPIQDMRPGMRVLAENPELMEADVEPLLIEPAQWRLVSLQMVKEESGDLDIELLRPLDWLEENKAQVGGTVELDLEELGAAGPAKVMEIAPCPLIEKGEGRIVTGRFAHTAANVIDVHIDGQDEPIGTTANHPFWSEDRQAFVPAGELKVGERLRTVSGSQASVKSLSPRGPPEAVYNLEVEGEHVYYVAELGLLVHNKCNITPVRRPDMAEEVLNVNGRTVSLFGQSSSSSRTAGHAAAIERRAREMAESGEYAFVFMQRSWRTATGRLSRSRRIPDIIGVRWNGVVDAFEVVSKSDKPKELLKRLREIINRLPAQNRGRPDVIIP